VVSFERAGDTPFLEANGFSEPNTISATVQVTYDLYDGGEVSDYLGELEARELELDVAKQQLEQSIYLELEEAYLNVKQAYGEILATAEAIVQAEENLRITRRRFEEGLAVVNDVIEAEALLLASQLSNTLATYNYYRAAAYIGKAVGVADLNYYLELRDKLALRDDENE
jgi:outer membrane protein TolC